MADKTGGPSPEPYCDEDRAERQQLADLHARVEGQQVGHQSIAGHLELLEFGGQAKVSSQGNPLPLYLYLYLDLGAQFDKFHGFGDHAQQWPKLMPGTPSARCAQPSASLAMSARGTRSTTASSASGPAKRAPTPAARWPGKAASGGAQTQKRECALLRDVPFHAAAMNLRPHSSAALAFGGLILMGMGSYFIFLRPQLLPEDPGFMGTTLMAITASLPGLAAWLLSVFWVFLAFAVPWVVAPVLYTLERK